MTVAYWCVLAMILYPYLFTSLAKWSNHFDNHDPRSYFEKISGWRKRANYVQLNSFEIVPAFGIAVIIAHLAHAPQNRIDLLALTFVISRIFYSICYLADKASLRSLFWFIGFLSVIALFVVAY